MALNFESTTYDLNTLFTFSFDFAQLKGIITEFSKKHEDTMEQINEMKHSLNHKDKLLRELQFNQT